MARFIKIGRRIKWTQDIPIEAQWDLMLHAAAAQNVNSLNNAAESMTEIEVMWFQANSTASNDLWSI